MLRKLTLIILFAALVIWVFAGCDVLRAGVSGVQQQQAIEQQKEVAGIPAIVIPEGSSTAEIIAYVGGSLGVLLSGLFLGKRYMPKNNS